MTVKDDGSTVTLGCDQCSMELLNTTMTDLMVNAAVCRWKVFNNPVLGVQHFCPTCGGKQDNELAVLIRNPRASVLDELNAEEQEDNNDFSLNLDEAIVADAADRANRVVPSMDVVKRKIAEEGEFSFGLDLGGDDEGSS